MRNIENEIARWKRRLEAPDRRWDPKVILEARQGNQNAAKLLVRRYERRLAKIIDTRLGEIQISDKEDIMQDTLSRIYQRIGGRGFGWKNEVSFFRFAVLTVTEAIANHLDDWHKGAVKSFNDEEFDSVDFFYEGMDDIETHEATRLLRELFDEMIKIELNRTNQKIMQWLVQGQSLNDISQKLKIPLRLLRARIKRSIEKLRSRRNTARYFKYP